MAKENLVNKKTWTYFFLELVQELDSRSWIGKALWISRAQFIENETIEFVLKRNPAKSHFIFRHNWKQWYSSTDEASLPMGNYTPKESIKIRGLVHARTLVLTQIAGFFPSRRTFLSETHRYLNRKCGYHIYTHLNIQNAITQRLLKWIHVVPEKRACVQLKCFEIIC
jgi:hypothetical protein